MIRTDYFRKKALAEGYRSRAAYKLMQMDDKHKILANRRGILELGAYPGGWTQVIRQRAPQAILVTCDLTEPVMPGSHGSSRLVQIHGDFRLEEIRHKITEKMKSTQVDLVLSDMSPNISGNRVTDQAGFRELAEDVLGYAKTVLTAKRGSLLIKFFQGEEIRDFVKQIDGDFRQVKIVKPDASKKESAEVYILANHFITNDE